MSTTTFTYAEFIGRTGSALGDYMEPVLADRSLRIPADVTARIVHELPGYDEHHLVYGLLLAHMQSPESVLPKLPGYLAHPEASVLTTAMNLLDSTPPEALTSELIESVRRVAGSNADRPFLSDLASRLEAKLVK